jgi:general stress protein YciG
MKQSESGAKLMQEVSAIDPDLDDVELEDDEYDEDEDEEDDDDDDEENAAAHSPDKMSSVDSGRKAGLTTRDRKLVDDPDYYRKIGALGGAKTSATHDSGYYEALGKKGGAATRRLGRKHFQAIGQSGGQRMSEMIAEGKVQ